VRWFDSIPWLIAISGWFAAHAFSEARERRKEVKGQLEKCCDRLASIEKGAHTFHTNKEFDPALARELMAQLDRVERTISRVQFLSVAALQPYIIAHRQSITLHNFDRSAFLQQDPDGELVHEITNTTLEFEDEIDRQYQNHYPTSFPFFRWPGFKKFLFFWR
jgi:hypothetical protein